MNKVLKSFSNLEIINIYSFINNMPKEAADELPLKFRWNLKKNIEKIRPIAEAYDNFRNENIQSLQNAWFDEEHSEEFMQTKTNPDGTPQLDPDGNEVTEPARKIKEEYMGEYTKAVQELNAKLNEIAMENNEVEIVPVDLDGFVDGLGDDTKLDFDMLTMLSFMDYNTNVVNKDTKEAE